MQHFFGTKKVDVNFTSTSVTLGVTTVVEFDNTDDIVKFVEWGRIYGGMHYRTSTLRGKVVAQKVARYIAAHYFLPVQ